MHTPLGKILPRAARRARASTATRPRPRPLPATIPVGIAAGLCALLATTSAAAQSSLDQKFAQGFDLNVFEPSPAGDRFFGVPDASSATDGRLRLGLVGDYTLSPTLRRTDDITGRMANIVSHQLYLHAGVAYPITDFLHASADIPFAAVQNGDTQATPKGGVFGDPRIGLRANVMSPALEAFAFGPAVDFWIPVGTSDNLAGDVRARLNAKLGMSGRAGVFIYSANGGYLVRKKLDEGSVEIGNAFTFSAAVGLSLFNDVLQIGPELWGNHQTNPDFNDSKVTPVTGLFGGKVRFGDFVAGVAGGGPLSESPAPGAASRIMLSLALAPNTHIVDEPMPLVTPTGPKDRDGDRIADADDACPDEAGVEARDPTKNGCPEVAVAAKPPEPAAPVDGDGDGVPDAEDACPDKLGDRTDDPKTNGCPKPRIVDSDGDGVRDEIDACPDVKGDTTSDPKTNGCPPKLPDADQDGVPDKDDACPHDAGNASSDPKTNGCPARVAAAPVAAVEPKGAKAVPGAAAITFAGFQAFADGSSRVYVQLTASVPVEAKVAGKKAEYRLVGANIPIRNNKNPLLAQHFVAQVVSARLVPEGKGKGKAKSSSARLVIQMREAAQPTYRLDQNADGTATLVVDFAKPSKPPLPEPEEQAPTPKASDASDTNR